MERSGSVYDADDIRRTGRDHNRLQAIEVLARNMQDAMGRCAVSVDGFDPTAARSWDALRKPEQDVYRATVHELLELDDVWRVAIDGVME